jgi:hypothetical protein
VGKTSGAQWASGNGVPSRREVLIYRDEVQMRLEYVGKWQIWSIAACQCFCHGIVGLLLDIQALRSVRMVGALPPFASII